MARCVFSLTLCCWPESARGADGDGSRTVVVVFEPHAEAMSRRLRQEIEALGFTVDLKPEGSSVDSLEALALQARAVAAIRVHPLQAGGVEMTVLDRATGKTVHRELAQVDAADAAGDELVATRTVELFRASLMELNADHPSRGAVRPSPPVEALRSDDEAKRNRRLGTLSLSAGPAITLMPSWRPGLSVWLEAAFVSRAGIGVAAAVFSPFSAARLTAPEGSVDLFANSYRLGAILVLGEDAAVSSRLGMGWSLSTLSLRGNASSPYVGLHDDHVAFGPWLSADGRVRLSAHVAMALQASFELALPRESIRFAGRAVADFARPALFVALGPELSWP